ncbi:MAG: FeoA family protein [Candidatus Accumulibacter sp.]|uniref:FeoA family protein n=1 Tax=Accumulibacter sp. TaxID=2053492 RepID=UPI00287B32CA|nr:FeoA family protein [Accumulibacter sp.]MDS4011080.1 FeoA family protein [Defluviicoccus sp.]MDS4014893.1 FeoA family protein [Accumulibacter sp.]
MAGNDSISLFDLPIGQEGKVSRAPVACSGAAAERELALRLVEIGFIEGERVRVVARTHPGGDPLAVRIGSTMFALRRCEAEQVLVAPLNDGGDALQREPMHAFNGPLSTAAAPTPKDVDRFGAGRRQPAPGARERRA